MDNEKTRPDEASEACEDAQARELTNAELDQASGGILLPPTERLVDDFEQLDVVRVDGAEKTFR